MALGRIAGIGAFALSVAGCSPELPGGDDLQLTEEQVAARNVAAQKALDYKSSCEAWRRHGGNGINKSQLRALDDERIEALSAVGLAVRVRLHCVAGKFSLEVLDD